MSAEYCVVCSDRVPGIQAIICYFCGGKFHYSTSRECGRVLPNPAAC